MMYLIEGRGLHETRGQYVLSIESAYAIAEEMKNDFPKVNIYAKENGEYKRIEKWERPMTRDEWLCSLTTEERAEAIGHLLFEKVGEFIRQREADNSMFTKEYWLKWLKENGNVERYERK